MSNLRLDAPMQGSWVGPSMLEEARRLLAEGRSLQAAAASIGVSARDLDLALWNNIGRPYLRA